MDIERRTFPAEELEYRAATEDDPARLLGRAIPYNTWSQDLGGFIERIAPGAFTDVLKTSDVRALFNHDTSAILGREKAKTLRLKDGARGMDFEVDLAETQVARDVAEHVRRQDITGNSFSFRVDVEGDTWEKDEKGFVRRTITRGAALLDVGPVTFPAYEKGTFISARALDRAQREQVTIIPMRMFHAKQEEMERRHGLRTTA